MLTQNFKKVYPKDMIILKIVRYSPRDDQKCFKNDFFFISEKFVSLIVAVQIPITKMGYNIFIQLGFSMSRVTDKKSS
jgi:hypothetical protein